MAFVEYESSRGGRQSVETDDLRVAWSSAGYDGKDPRYSVCITIGEKICREYRVTIGDRLRVLVDHDSGLVQLKRCLSEKHRGWKLCKPGGGGDKAWDGKYSKGLIRFMPDKEMMEFLFPNKEKSYLADNVTVKDEGILFAVAKKA